jgi:membrane-associated phospholipid phosphatase
MTRTTRTALAGALFAALGVALLRVLAFVPSIHHADAVVLRGFIDLDRPWLYHKLVVIAHSADPVPYVLIGALLIGIAVRRERIRAAAATAVVLAGAAVTTDYVLKPLLSGHRYDAILTFHQIPDGSFPSGHATASMAMALCAVLVSPPRYRPFVAALGALFAIVVCYSFLSLGWHYPSDVLGGYLVAGAWMSVAVAVLSEADARWPAHSGRQAAGRVLSKVQARALTAAIIGALLVAVGVVAAVAPGRALDFLRVHTLFAVGAGAIALAGLTVAGVLTALLRD